ncbi:beta-N-acetylhexosaminidase [Saccharopolyspora rhizosphaerae]|uniref:beta-N-acetylhexosaminidase n=1 Tax=Saccharopolyspora rhizosphaerae TaxID=2492662 RepID=A0A3R8P8D3_9PSEU|nr:beta-N-acetylhexosaminidase [Saccharopolyspora rhizosphaerae]RRO18938.1 beta-N-acetylhexosaminidase [Saccharopolyspora rhizosphaerae]
MSGRPRSRAARAGVAIAAGALLAAGAVIPASGEPAASALDTVVPAPESVQPDPESEFELTEQTAVLAPAEAAEVGEYLAGVLRPSTGLPVPVNPAMPGTGDIALALDGDADLGPEGYRLQVTDDAVTLRATSTDGLFHGVQTLRQLLPASIESPSPQPGPWTMPGGVITDKPRFAHRSAQLDPARHFFTVDMVKRYIDQVAKYKVNKLHLHLTDDQGWRLQINSWPRLAEFGGQTEVGGTPGGYYTQQEYTEIVNYAASRHMTVIPEIDMPGHTNAALSSYAELNCDGVAPPPYTGIEVGFSSLCVGKDITYTFVEDVIREVAALTPGPYLHIGGDEAHSTTDEDYVAFMSKVLPLVEKYGKKPLGWHEYGKAAPQGDAVLQFWGTTPGDPLLNEAVARGNKVLASPANKTYLDMKYDENTPLGLQWAGFIEVADAYGWDPGSYLQGVPEEAVLGVEAPMFSETLETSQHIEFMAFPRLPALAELGWSPKAALNWESFRNRLAAHGPRWEAAGQDFYRSPQVPWAD